MNSLGQWEVIVVTGVDVGYEHSGHGLSARYDTRGMNPTITASSPMHQPVHEGTWTGMWAGVVGEDLDTEDDGTAEVRVMIQGSDVRATLSSDVRAGASYLTGDGIEGWRVNLGYHF